MNRYRAQYFINEDEHTQYIDAESENSAMDRIPDKADRIRIIQMSVEEILYYELLSIKGSYERQKAKMEILYRYDLNYKKQKDAYLREWYRRRSKDPVIRERINASRKRAYHRNIEARRAYARQYYYEKKKARTNSDATATAQA